ncbi:hypothetical protein ZIOFF_051819 [Zingiber officinale]|uniref:phosphoenolpyruvate carboxykinase (ATP) n=1 Tax=Zingiber officinale TaxID=94328 RepID=A0A8J5FRS0_ZINOF|nr:hypothetical protein ZIOFF_051819 [Zingiber officinale]
MVSGDVLQWAAEDPNAREGEIGERDLPRRQRAGGEGEDYRRTALPAEEEVGADHPHQGWRTARQRCLATISKEERQKLQLQSISDSLASLTRETGPKVLRGDPARKAEATKVATEHHHYLTPTISVSDSALKFTHVLYNLSPPELYEQAIKHEHGSFITSTGALATLSGTKTGRSPRDKHVVKDETTANELWWGNTPDFTIYNAGQFPCNRYTHYMTTSTSIDLNLDRKEMVILGTQYAGEMNKGLFGVMHYLMPKRNILSLHSSNNMGKDGDVALFFGLSGRAIREA